MDYWYIAVEGNIRFDSGVEVGGKVGIGLAVEG